MSEQGLPGYRFLAVQLSEEYGVRKVTAEAWGCGYDQADARRETDDRARIVVGPFRGDEIGGLVLTAFVCRPGDHVWDSGPIYGTRAVFQPHEVTVTDARRMTRVLTALEKRIERIAQQDGRDQSYAEWLVRHAKILGCTRIRLWVPDGPHRQKLDAPMRLSEGAAWVETLCRRWAEGKSRQEVLAS